MHVGGMREVEGWFEAGIKTSWLQLVRELSIHNGPGSPITLTSAALPSTPVWIVQVISFYGTTTRKLTRKSINSYFEREMNLKNTKMQSLVP